MSQSVFTSDGTIAETLDGMNSGELKRYKSYLDELDRRKHIRAVCPWCLYVSKLDKFTTHDKKYVPKKTLTCPKCFNNMRPASLQIFDNGPEAYSQWVWEQIFTWKGAEKFHDWADLKSKVYEYGFSKIFWDTYHEFKENRNQSKRSSSLTPEALKLAKGLFKFTTEEDEDD